MSTARIYECSSVEDVVYERRVAFNEYETSEEAVQRGTVAITFGKSGGTTGIVLTPPTALLLAASLTEAVAGNL